MALKLSNFYQEIAMQHKQFIFTYRFISFFAGFVPSVRGLLPPEYGTTNLNILPSVDFKMYSITMVLISLVVFVSFLFFVRNWIRSKGQVNIVLLAMYLLVFSFWGINFAFVTMGDANRFKFPAEPFIFGLFLYNLTPVFRKTALMGSNKPG